MLNLQTICLDSSLDKLHKLQYKYMQQVTYASKQRSNTYIIIYIPPNMNPWLHHVKFIPQNEIYFTQLSLRKYRIYIIHQINIPLLNIFPITFSAYICTYRGDKQSYTIDNLTGLETSNLSASKFLGITVNQNRQLDINI